MGFSTYTTRFSRFDADLTLDPRNLSVSKVVATIDASSFEMDAAPQMCLDIMKGPQMLDTAKFPQIVFKSEKIRMTGAKSVGSEQCSREPCRKFPGRARALPGMTG